MFGKSLNYLTGPMFWDILKNYNDCESDILQSYCEHLKQQSGIDTRRLSRLSLIAALGAGQLKEQSEICSNCAVFLGTPFSSPSVFEKISQALELAEPGVTNRFVTSYEKTRETIRF